MDIQPLDILKWIGLALAAGFIGYFGRYLSMLIIEKIHKRKVEPQVAAQTTDNTEGESVGNTDREKLKLEKKRLKQESKTAKKKGTG